MVPVIGEVADVANGVWYAAEGNYADAALSMAAAIPGVGAAATAAKWAKKGAKAADAVKGGTKNAPKAKPKTSKPKPKKTADQPAPKKQGGSCKVKPKKNSFVPGTKVLMADGSTKNIEDLKEGEYVLASDPETGNLQARQITDTRDHSGVKHLITLTVDPDGKDGDAKPETITATDEHPFWLPDFGKWVNADHLEPGMWLQTSAGTWVQITAIDEAHRTQRVHNLTVDGQHTYFVVVGSAAVLVHNFDPECELAKLPSRPGGSGPTRGRSSLSDETIVSGQSSDALTRAAKRSISDRLRELGKWGNSTWGDADHVEMKVVHMMGQRNVDHAELVINNQSGPCMKAAPALSCMNTLDSLLGSKTLRVHWRDEMTGEMTSKLFGGLV
ncbi:polymorphic toxin-type HINT domain-containing protein [Streptomyces sp. NPDC002835]